jgi:shikimate kinase
VTRDRCRVTGDGSLKKNYLCKKIYPLRYFVIGYKNSGKTTFGRKLAEKLGLEFTDLDELIEKINGKTIPEIYTDVGDDAFRRLEWKALRSLVKKENIVVSTGGGAPCHCENMNLMEQYGDVIYLKVSDEILVARLKKAAKNRPIVKGKTEEELRIFITELRSRCEHHLNRARYIVDGENLNIDDFITTLER